MKNKTASAVLAVSVAYICWGTLTAYWNLLANVSAVYIISQRVIWSMVFMGLYAVLTHTFRETLPVFRNGKALFKCFLCGVLVTINWGVYIYAVNNGHVLDASLGYFIEPLLVGAIGMFFFKEKTSVLEKLTFIFSLAGLIYMIATTKTFPSLAVLIAGSFAVYGAIKKKMDVSPHVALFMETLCMTPFAIIFALYADQNGIGSVDILAGAQFLLLPLCGIVTSIPLLLFNIGVKNLPYYLSGILMYLNPTLQFLMGLFYFHEAMDHNRLIAFLFIWVGVLFTVADKLLLLHKSRAAAQ